MPASSFVRPILLFLDRNLTKGGQWAADLNIFAHGIVPRAFSPNRPPDALEGTGKVKGAERHQRVIDTGSDRAVRHPGYIAAVLLFFEMALSLGSSRALIPAAFASAILIVRIRMGRSTAASRACRICGLCQPGMMEAGSGPLVRPVSAPLQIDARRQRVQRSMAPPEGGPAEHYNTQDEDGGSPAPVNLIRV